MPAAPAARRARRRRGRARHRVRWRRARPRALPFARDHPHPDAVRGPAAGGPRLSARQAGRCAEGARCPSDAMARSQHEIRRLRRHRAARISPPSNTFPTVDFADYERRLADDAGDPAARAAGLSRHVASRRHRAGRLGHRRQGRRGPPARLGARSAQLQGTRDRRAGRAREVAALPAALLGAPAAARPDRRVRPFLVWPRAGGARRRLRHAEPNGIAPTTRSTTSSACCWPTARGW